MALRASRPRTRSRATSDTADLTAPYKAAKRRVLAKTGGAAGGPVLLVVQSCPVTPVGIVGDFCRERGATLRTVHIHQGQRLPRTTAGLDGLIILGGPMHAGDDDGYPAFRKLLPLIRRFHQEAKPIYGICLGAQLIARAFEGQVFPFGGLEIGYLPLRLTAAAARDRLLAGLAPEQRLMQLHQDSFDLPEGAVLLMANDTCAHQAYRLGETTYGFQFHLEVTERDARNFPRDCWTSVETHYGDLAEAVEAKVVAEVAAHFEDGAAFTRTVTGRWMDLVEDRRQAVPAAASVMGRAPLRRRVA
jgi:GMP synthase-like glutamine amidotransferase